MAGVGVATDKPTVNVVFITSRARMEILSS
jgi:hypothetical protein